MPPLNYINQTAPFWDFVASLEQEGPSHPSFNRGRGTGQEESEGSNQAQPEHPWILGGQGQPGFPFQQHPLHGPFWNGPGRHAHPLHHLNHPGQRPFYHHQHPHPLGFGGEPHANRPQPPSPAYTGERATESDQQQQNEGQQQEQEQQQQTPGEEPPHRFRGHRNHCGRRGRFRGGPFAATPFGLGDLSNLIQRELFGAAANTNSNSNGHEANTSNEDHEPDADIFDTESAYVIHVSLAGAKKEDVGVSWDPEKSELSIAGVIYRPGDEEFLKTLVVQERKVGAFQRRIRLGSRANPAQVDEDAITAKLEDGVLRIEVPKQDRDYVEIKKVDIL